MGKKTHLTYFRDELKFEATSKFMTFFKPKSETDDIYAKIKKTQALRALERSIFSNGTSLNGNSQVIKPASSVESICSVASTASFSYVPINKKSNKPKLIPLGPTCGQDTYKQRVESRRKRVVQDLNVSLTTKYKLQPADYSPPSTLRQKENLSAITGPNLPTSGPNLYSPKSRIRQKNESDSDEENSEEISDEEESTLSVSSWTKSNNFQLQKSTSHIIKPKERLGQSMQAKTITNKNSLMEIGSGHENLSAAPPNSAPFQLSRSDTLKG